MSGDAPGTELAPIDSEVAAIERTMRAEPDVYFRDVDLQQRYRNLVEAKSSGRPVAPRAASAVEKAEIEKMMGDASSDYWRGPRAGELQARYRALLQGNVGNRASADAPQAPRAAVAAAENILFELGETEGRWLIQAFDDYLPEAAQQSIITELADGPTFVSPASEAEIETFRGHPDSAAMIAEWGDAAAAKVGILRARFQRIFGRLPPGDREQTWHWINTTTSAQYRTICKHLVGR